MQKIKNIQVFLFVLILAIFPYCYLCFFANPSADDFSLSGQAQNNELLHLIYFNYLNWNGRYISNVLIYLNPLVFGSFIGYKIVSFFIIISFCLANFVFITQIFYTINKVKRVVFSMVLTLLFFQNMPIISEGIYWYTGAVIYSLGLIIAQLYFSVFIRFVRNKKKKGGFVLLTLLLFISCGFNEVLTLLMVFFLTVISWIFYQQNLKRKKLVVLQLLFTIVFASIVIFAPGNAVRGAVYPQAHQLAHSLFYSFLQVGRFILLWLASVPLIAASFLYFQVNKTIRKNNKWFKNSFYLKRWQTLLLLFIVVFIGVFPPYWATGILGQHRTLNVVYFFFLPLWFINLTVWFNYYQHQLRFSLTSPIKRGLTLFLLVGTLFTSNGINSLNDIFSGTAQQYNSQLNIRFETLKKITTTKNKEIRFKPLKVQPKCLFSSDITDNPNYWTNQAYNLYFRKDSVEIYLK